MSPACLLEVGSGRRLENHPLQVSHKQNWGRGLILLLPQAAVMSEPDAGSDGVQLALGFVIQNCQNSCSVWYLMYGARYQNVVCDLFRGAAIAIRQKSKTPFVHGRMESLDTSQQAIELNASCLEQARSNRPSTGPRHENTEPGCILTVLRFPSIIRPLENADAKFGKVV